MFSLESPHRGDSEAILMSTHNIPSPAQKKKITLIDSTSAAMGFFSKGPKNEFETAVVNEPSVFEPLKFYCICNSREAWHTLYSLLLSNYT